MTFDEVEAYLLRANKDAMKRDLTPHRVSSKRAGYAMAGR